MMSKGSPSTRFKSLKPHRSPSCSSTLPIARSRSWSKTARRSATPETSFPPIEGVQIEYGGDLFSEFELPESEIYGILAAVVILIIAFGSVLAMGLPIGTALFGLGCATAIVTLLSNPIAMPDFTTAMVAMIGIGVGIDYALFIVTRYREALHAGLSPEDSVAEAIDTSGRAVIFAGTTVAISLMGLTLIGLEFVTAVALAAAVGVVLMVLRSDAVAGAARLGRRSHRRHHAAAHLVALVVIGVFAGVAFGAAAISMVAILLPSVYRRELLLQAFAAPARSPPAGAAQGAALLVPLEPCRPASSMAQRHRGRRLPAHPGDPAALAAPRLRRLRQLSGEPDGAPGLRPARRRLRAGATARSSSPSREMPPRTRRRSKSSSAR